MKTIAFALLAAVTIMAVSCKKDGVSVESVTVKPAELSMYVGDSYTLEAEIVPEYSNDDPVSWKSSNSSIVEVSYGKVRAYKAGTVTITATAGGVSGSCAVSVKPKPEELHEDK